MGTVSPILRPWPMVRKTGRTEQAHFRGEKGICVPILGPPSSQVAIVGSAIKPLEQVCKSASDASDPSDADR